MRGIQANDDLAKSYLEVALLHNKLYDFVFSTPLYDLQVDDGYGNGVHSAKHVMKALYNKQLEDPSIDMEKKITEVIINNLKEYKYHGTILNLLENLEYHIHAEKNKIATFKLDTIKLFDEIKTHLNKNQIQYKQETRRNGKHGLWPQLELFDVRMQSSTGRKIM